MNAERSVQLTLLDAGVKKKVYPAFLREAVKKIEAEDHGETEQLRQDEIQESATSMEEKLEALDNEERDDGVERCPHCGNTPQTGACFYCKMD